MTDKELLKEARDLLMMCTLLDKSGQCEAMVDKIDKQLSITDVVVPKGTLVCRHDWKYNACNRVKVCKKCNYAENY